MSYVIAAICLALSIFIFSCFSKKNRKKFGERFCVNCAYYDDGEELGSPICKHRLSRKVDTISGKETYCYCETVRNRGFCKKTGVFYVTPEDKKKFDESISKLKNIEF